MAFQWEWGYFVCTFDYIVVKMTTWAFIRSERFGSRLGANGWFPPKGMWLNLVSTVVSNHIIS